MNALNVLCAQVTRYLFAIAEFLLTEVYCYAYRFFVDHGVCEMMKYVTFVCIFIGSVQQQHSGRTIVY